MVWLLLRISAFLLSDRPVQDNTALSIPENLSLILFIAFIWSKTDAAPTEFWSLWQVLQARMTLNMFWDLSHSNNSMLPISWFTRHDSSMKIISPFSSSHHEWILYVIRFSTSLMFRWSPSSALHLSRWHLEIFALPTFSSHVWQFSLYS